MVQNFYCRERASFLGELLALVFMLGSASDVYSGPASKVVAEKTVKKVEQKDKEIDLKAVFALLDAGVTVYEQFLGQGSASALNQIATSYYVMAESMEDREKAVDYYKRAAYYFEKAAEAGISEARYNAGLVRSKLGEYAAAADHYWLCCKWALTKENVTIVLKAALNWVVLIVDGNDHPSLEKFKRLLGVLQGYKANFQGKTEDDSANTERAMNATAALNAYWRNILEQDLRKGPSEQDAVLSEQKLSETENASKQSSSIQG